MIRDLTIGQYFPGTSLIHRLDPRTKILVTLSYTALLFIVETPVGYGVLTAFTVAVIILSRIPPGVVLKSIRPLWFIILLTIGIHFFMTPGTTVAALGPLTLTREGLRQGLYMAARLVLLIVVSSLLTFTTSPIILTDGIERLLKPFRRIGVPAHELAMMMTIALRFIPTLLEEADKIMKAQMARGADFASGNLLVRARNMVPLLVPLFVGAFRRADDLAVAMEARCYRGGEQRSRLRELRFTAPDFAAFLLTGVMAGMVIFMRYGVR